MFNSNKNYSYLINKWKHLTLWKKNMSSGSFKSVIDNIYLEIIDLLYMYKKFRY